MRESAVSNSILVTLNKMIRLFRNHVGVVKDERGRFHRFGLFKGSADLIGYTKIKITPNMVGKELPIFTSIEVKNEKGRISPDQQKWLQCMKKINALATVARSPEDVEETLKKYIKDLES